MKTLVVKVSGKAIDRPEEARVLWSACVEAARSSRLVLVHGGGKQVDALLARLGEPTERVDGIRLTPASQMGLIAGVLAGEVNLTLVGALLAEGVRAAGLALGSSGVLRTRVDPKLGERGGRVGLAETGPAPLVELLTSKGYVPVVSSIGIDAEGGLLNINADDAAGALASSLGADELVFVSDVEGVAGADGRVIERIAAGEVEQLIARGVVTGGMAAKLRAASAIAQSRGTRIVITSASGAAALLAGGGCVCTAIELGEGRS